MKNGELRDANDRLKHTKMRHKQNGITLVSLVITIILLLILATISIQALTNQGIFTQASRAKKETQRAQVTEWLNLKLMEEQMYKPTGTAEEIIEATRTASKGNAELAKLGKNVVVDTNTSTIEDGEQVDVYFYVQVDEDVYKVEMSGAKFIGEKGKFPPVIILEDITNTTNSITIKVKTSRNEEGKIEFYIKKEGETEYTSKYTAKGEEAKGLEYTFTELEQNKNYSIKIVAIAKNGQIKEYTKDVTLESVPDLAEGDITFTYSVDGQEIDKETWTNKSVTVTASTEITGYTLKTSTDGKTWSNETSQTFIENGKIYVVLYDGTNYGGSATGNVTNIDTTAPTIGSATGTTATGNTGTITVSSIADTGGSGLKGYYVSEVNTNTAPTETSVTWAPSTASSFTKTVSANGTYYVWVIDNAGNISAVTSCTVSGIVSKASITAYTGVTINVGSTGTPTLTYTGTPKTKTFASSNTTVATINSSTGVVTGVSAGTATMTVTLTNYDETTVTATTTVTVKVANSVTASTATTHIAKAITYSWDELSTIAQMISNNSSITNDTLEVNVKLNGVDNTIGVGDTATVDSQTVRILGFNHDTLTTSTAYDGEATATGKAGISFEYVDFIDVDGNGTIKAGMNSTNTNTGGWGASTLRSTLNSTTYNNLSIKGKIKQVNKEFIQTYNDADSIDENNPSTDYLWLLSCGEIWDNGYNGGVTRGYAIATEGSQYKYYKSTLGSTAYNSSTDITKKPNTSSATSWWLRSPGYAGSNYFCIVFSLGYCGFNSADYSNGVAPGFCI